MMFTKNKQEYNGLLGSDGMLQYLMTTIKNYPLGV